jgi:hypothetical protein
MMLFIIIMAFLLALLLHLINYTISNTLLVWIFLVLVPYIKVVLLTTFVQNNEDNQYFSVPVY